MRNSHTPKKKRPNSIFELDGSQKMELRSFFFLRKAMHLNCCDALLAGETRLRDEPGVLRRAAVHDPHSGRGHVRPKHLPQLGKAFEPYRRCAYAHEWHRLVCIIKILGW